MEDENNKIDRAISDVNDETDIRRFMEDATIKFFNHHIAELYMYVMPQKIILKADNTIEYIYTEVIQNFLNALNKQKMDYIKAKFPKIILDDKK